MPHSNQIREFLITSHGVDLVEPYIGPEGVLTGTARTTQEVRERLAVEARVAEDQRQARLLSRKRDLLEQKIAALRAEFAAEELELHQDQVASDATRIAWERERERMRSARGSARSSADNTDRAARTEKPAAAALASRRRNGSAAPRPQRA
jgi:circadian clock protein KaiC